MKIQTNGDRENKLNELPKVKKRLSEEAILKIFDIMRYVGLLILCVSALFPENSKIMIALFIIGLIMEVPTLIICTIGFIQLDQ